MSRPTISITDLKDRVKNYNFNKQASASAATDPAEKGSATATQDPALSDAKSNMPPSKENTSNEGKKLEDQPLQPSSTSKNMPVSPKDGNAEDKKGVEKAASIRGRVQSLLKKTAAAPSTKAEEPKAEGVAKTATADPVVDPLTPAQLQKLASAIFETEEGVDTILPLLRKKNGQDAAIELLKQAAADYQNMLISEQRAAEAEYLAKQEEDAFHAYVAELTKTASSREEAEHLIKAAAVHYENTKGLTELEKLAYAQGPEDAGAMLAAEEGGGDPSLEGAEEPTIEQIAQLIQLAVQNQEISPEEGEAMLQELMAAAGGEAGGGAPPAEGGPPMSDPAAAAAPQGEPDGDEIAKEASAAKNLLNKLRK